MSNLSSQESEANEDGQPPMEGIRLDVDNIAQIELARDDYLTIGVPLYRATMRGDWKEAKAIIEQREDIVRTAITNKQEIALHIAVAANHKGFVQTLLKTMKDADLTLRNEDGNTAFCFAAAAGAIEIAEMLINRNNNLPMMRGGGKMTPIRMAALFGHGNMVRFLYEKTVFADLDDEELRNLFLAIVSAGIYDIALKMLEENIISSELALNINGGEETALRVMASKPFAISHKKQLNSFQKLANSGFFREAKMRTIANQLVEKLWESALRLPNEQFLQSHSDVLFDAARSGNVELLVILIRSYPDLIWRVDDENRTLFHIAAMNRHENIFNIIFEIGSIKDFLTLHKETQTEDSLLHLVARLPPPNRLQIGLGAALQMQREIHWFKTVEKVVPHSYINDKNSSNEVAHELFTKEHEDLRIKGEQWMKHTATSCMLVATLIATVVFAAAFTLPGGNNEKTGFPIFRKKLWFNVFVTSNQVALFSSVTSIVIFLSILTSRFAEDDFLTALPSKLMSGLTSLFVSLISMVIAFTTALISMRHQEPIWSLILIICLASLTSLAYVVLHFKLRVDPFYSSARNFLFHPGKTGLYS